MLRIGLAVAFAGLVLGLVGTRPAAAGIEEIDYATYDARVTDSKGVTTDVTDLGYMTGINVLLAYRGDADVEIPFRMIKTIEIGDFVAEQRRAPCRVTLRSGKTVALEIDSIEEGRLLKAKAEFGDYRIRMGKVRRLELIALSHTGGRT